MSQTPSLPMPNEPTQTATPLNDETFEAAATPDSDFDAIDEESSNPPDDTDDDNSGPERPAQQPVGSVNQQNAERQPEPYDFARCGVTLALRLLPNHHDADGRRVVVTVTSHDDAPLIRAGRLKLESLPPLLQTALTDFVGELPNREAAYHERERKKQQEEEKRKAAAANRTTRRSVTKPAPAAKIPKKKKLDLSAAPDQINLASSQPPTPPPLVASGPQEPATPDQTHPSTKPASQPGSLTPMTSTPLMPTATEETVQALLFE